MDVTPPSKYFMLQEFLMKQVPDIKEDVESMFVGDNAPKWIVVKSWHLNDDADISSVFKSYISEHCEEIKFQDSPSPFKLFTKKKTN